MANEFKTKNGLITQTLSVQSANALRFYNSSDTFYSAFKAGSPTSNVIWTLPSTDSTGQQALVSNGSGTLSWVTLTSGGTVTSVSGTGTVSGITLTGTVTSSGSLTLGGTLNLSSPPTIGNTTPNTGAFTSLTGNGTISITGTTTGSMNNITIGATTAAAGTFTNISSSTSPTNTVPALALTGTPGSAAGGKTGVLGVGSNFTASDKNIISTFIQNINDYTQIVLQNPNSGATASMDFIINNDNTTGAGVYQDIGINSSAYTGTGSLSLANASYHYSSGGDLVIGTATANIVRFIINSSTTDIGTITSTGLNAMAIGATTASTGAFTTLSGTGALTFNTTTNNQSFTTTGAGTITITSGTAGNINNMIIGATTPAAITGTTITDSIGNVRTIVQNPQSGAGSYTLVATDAGKHIYITGTGGVTCPVSVFGVGQAITIVNNTAASITITAPSAGTLYLAGTATTGNRTLAQRGVANLLYVVGGATPSIISSGAGLT